MLKRIIHEAPGSDSVPSQWFTPRRNEVYAIREVLGAPAEEVHRLIDLPPGEEVDLLGPYAGFASLSDALTVFVCTHLGGPLVENSRSSGMSLRALEALAHQSTKDVLLLEIQHRMGARILEYRMPDWYVRGGRGGDKVGDYLIAEAGPLRLLSNGTTRARFPFSTPVGDFEVVQDWPVIRLGH